MLIIYLPVTIFPERLRHGFYFNNQVISDRERIDSSKLLIHSGITVFKGTLGFRAGEIFNAYRTTTGCLF